MALKLDQLIGKKKDAVQILDLSNATANTAQEFKKVMEKVPEFKIKPEKVKPEDIKIQDRPGRGRRGLSRVQTGYQFADPVPPEMKSVTLDELCSVDIQWTMLTTLRPSNKLQLEYFSRLVELGRLRLRTEEKEKKVAAASFLRRMKNRTGIIESRFLSCKECGEEFCQQETCCIFQYDQFKRPSSEDGGKKAAESREPGDGASNNKNKQPKPSRKKKKRTQKKGTDTRDTRKKGAESGQSEADQKRRKKREGADRKDQKRKRAAKELLQDRRGRKTTRRRRAWQRGANTADKPQGERGPANEGQPDSK